MFLHMGKSTVLMGLGPEHQPRRKHAEHFGFLSIQNMCVAWEVELCSPIISRKNLFISIFSGPVV